MDEEELEIFKELEKNPSVACKDPKRNAVTLRFVQSRECIAQEGDIITFKNEVLKILRVWEEVENQLWIYACEILKTL